ncbi:permease, partial [Thermodesulfobacteriota bacterium]
MQIIIGILTASWNIFQQSAIYMLLGFFIAGILYVFVKAETISQYLGKGKVRSVFLSAAIGIPLPLCSCGVVPAAAGLKKQGASKGATLSFLISTPETGADSIPITYALMDPIMTVMRPVAAFITAIVAGITENYFGKSDDRPLPGQSLHATGSSGCAIQNAPFQMLNKGSFAGKIAAGLKYAFVELLGDIGPWFVLGVLLAGLISYFVPANFADSFLDNQFL